MTRDDAEQRLWLHIFLNTVIHGTANHNVVMGPDDRTNWAANLADKATAKILQRNIDPKNWPTTTEPVIGDS